MKVIDPKTEQRLLICALDHPKKKIRNLILGRTDTADYGSEFAKEAREVMDRQLQRGKPLGTAIDFAEMPSLSQEAQEFVRSTAKTRKKVASYSKEDVEALIYKLHLHKRLRQAFAGLEKASEILMKPKVDEEGLDEFKTILENTLMEVGEEFDDQPMQHIGTGQSEEEMEELIDRVVNPEAQTFIKTGTALDKLYTLARGNVVTISANSGGGKTAFALNLATSAAALGYKALYYSLEMSKLELNGRLSSSVAQVNHDRIRDGRLNKDEKKDVSKAMRKYRKRLKKTKGRLTIWDVKTDSTPMKLELAAKPFKFDIIVIDYITLFSSKFQDTWKMQMEYSRFLKQMAKRMNCLVIILSQLNEDEQIKYGKAIKENTDYWFYWRYGEEEEEEGQTEMKAGKARHNKKKSINLNMMLDVMTITGSVEEMSSVDTSGREVKKRRLSDGEDKKSKKKRSKKRLKKAKEEDLGEF